MVMLQRTQGTTTTTTTVSDGYALCFSRARRKLECWMRGDPLDVAGLAQDLFRLPDNVCRTLVQGLPRELSQQVMRTVAELRR